MADSGRIFATDNPFPIQNPRTPFSTYMLVIALVIDFIPNDLDPMATDGSGCRVIKNILSRSSGAVNVRETEDRIVRNKSHTRGGGRAHLLPLHPQPTGILQRYGHRTRRGAPPRGLQLPPVPLLRFVENVSGRQVTVVG